MADPTRFPSLALPFAIVGAAAGWLSAGVVNNPLLGGRVSQPAAAICACVVAAVIGLIVKRLCLGRRYGYELGDPDPELRPATDRSLSHASLVVLGGAATGGVVGCAGWSWVICAAGGALCALLFVPVCLVVVGAARRAQRGRLGSLVAETDRRAVWGILALTLAASTLEALPDWPASNMREVSAPSVVVGALVAVAAATLWILRGDLRALARAREAIDAGLTAREPGAPEPEESEAVPRLDLGLGDDLAARVARGAAAYRQRERTIALVRGDPSAALSALERAVRRGRLGLALVAAVVVAHGVAVSTPALVAYEALRCNAWCFSACRLGADLLPNSDLSVALRRRAALDGAVDPSP